MGASGAMRGSLSQAPGVMLCDFPFSLWKPLEAKPTYSSMCGHAFFLIHCHSLGERTNKDDFWQPEKIGLQLSEIFPKKMRKKEGQPTQSALSHLAFSHTHWIRPRCLVLHCLCLSSTGTRTSADTCLRKWFKKRKMGGRGGMEWGGWERTEVT